MTSYREAHSRFVEALGTVPRRAMVPACPAWTVHQLLAHQVHQLEGACEGTFPVVDAIDALLAPEPERRAAAAERQQAWIEKGVGSLAREPLARLVEMWEELIARAPDVVLSSLAPDLVVHLVDLLGVSGQRLHPDDEWLVADALQFWGTQALARLEQANQGRWRLSLGSVQIGEPDAPTIAVEATPVALLEMLTGRCTREEGARMVSSVVRPQVLDSLALYGWRSSAGEV